MKLLICAGGTGGGVYPALAVQHALTHERPDVQTLWIGGEGGMEADLVKRAGIPFQAIPAAGVHGVGARALPGNLARLGRGLLAARRILQNERPDALLFTGGYVAVPMALAARLPGLGFPRPRSVLYIPDIEPGLALKVLIRFADHITLTTETSRTYLPPSKPATVTGYPLRPDLGPRTKETARQALALTPGERVLLVSGGSKGARSINRALLANLTALLPDMAIIHTSGTLDWPAVEAARAALPNELAARYHAYPYLHEMGAALALADLVVSRAGASCLGEYPAFGLPAVLVPYPYAWRYQKVNADYLAERGAAVVIENDALADGLLPLVRSLMSDAQRRAAMRQAMQALHRPNAAQSIAAVLIAQT
jgi:UDP-N-acetylglucosamine--N-acetylmuramyl-(pentapeptide) pyrophosphoryl-undecaprenol N-acetylglucosamine transferase